MTQPTPIVDPRRWLPYISQTLRRSPLYAHLYACLEQDLDLLELLALVDQDQPIPVLFFTVVNDLLLRDRDHPLAAFYPYLTPSARPATEAYPAFRHFCLSHQDELRARLPVVRLQTNEVTRCANLVPAFDLVFRRGGRKLLSLIELCSSAGLNLNWMHYGYHYGPRHLGNLDSPVQIVCDLTGDLLPLLPEALPPVANCLGIELCPLDLTREEDVRWLRACIWPEELGRHFLLDAALAVAQQYPPRVLAGDASDLLPDILAALPIDQTVCLWHSFALNQGIAQIRTRIEDILVAASRRQTIYRLALEAEPGQQGRLPRLELFTYRSGALANQQWLANCALHGEQMEWRFATV